MLASGWKLLQGCMATADNEVTYTYIMTSTYGGISWHQYFMLFC